MSAFTWLVAALAGGASLVATLIDYFDRGALPARSGGGIGVMLVSSAMLVTAVVLFLKLHRFASRGRPTRVAVGIVAPLAGLVLIGLFMRLGLRSPSPVLPLPFTPTVSLRFSAGGSPQIVVLPSKATSGGVRWSGNRSAFEYECFLAPKPVSKWPLREPLPAGEEPRQSIVSLSATASAPPGREDCRMTVVAGEAITLYLGGLLEPEITVDGKPMPSPLSLGRGTYQLTIAGSYEQVPGGDR